MINEQDICKAYTDLKLGQYNIAKKFNITVGSLKSIFKRNNVKLRSHKEAIVKKNIDSLCFHSESKEAHYWAGFLMADGCVHQPKRGSLSLILTIQKTDINHLKKFKEFLKSDHKISVIKAKLKYIKNRLCFSKDLVSLSIMNQSIVEWLILNGISQNKTFTAKASESLSSSIDFWRGCIDGDGYISKSGKPRIELVGSNPLITQFSDFINTILNIKAKVSPKNSIYRVRYGGSIALKVIKLLYYEKCYGLDRKIANARYNLNKLTAID